LNTLTTFAGNVDVYDIRYFNGDPTDPLQDALTTYLNRPEIQRAMNADHSWGACNQAPYFRLLDDIARSSEFLFPKILEQIPVLLYNGNKDLICNMVGTQRWSDAMQWKYQSQFKNAPVNKWTVNGQEAGNWKSANGLTRLVVLNAGHMVPFSQPAFAFDMLSKFIAGDFH
jgi:carboxypeptidase C (cathepsin A)